MSTTAIKRADIAVFSADGKLQLIVEVKNKRNASTDWAINMRRNLYMHAMLPDAPYFLLALPERFYLWSEADSAEPLAAPDYEVPAESLLIDYIDAPQTSLDRLSEDSLELLVGSWLMNLVNANISEETAQSHDRWLFESGLYDAIRNGDVHIEAGI